MAESITSTAVLAWSGAGLYGASSDRNGPK